MLSSELGVMKFTQGSHSVYKTEYHIVWVTKYRRKALSPSFAKYTKTVIKDMAGKLEGVVVKEINVQPEHIHIYMVIPPKYSVAKIVEILKSRSAKVVREKFDWLDKVYFGTKGLWSVGYLVSTVGVNDKVIRKYVKYQKRQDSGQLKIELESCHVTGA